MNTPLMSDTQRRAGKSAAQKSYWCHALCLGTAMLMIGVIVIVSVLTTSHSTSELSNGSPSRSLVRKGNNMKKDTSDHLKPRHSALDQNMHFEWEEQDSSFYPVTIALDNNRKLSASDSSAASEYYHADGQADLMDSMPGLIESTCSASPTNCGFRQYSGYLLANDNREIHYWFIEADDADFANKPLLVWTNGGPGCSGMDGLLTEHGPWRPLEGGSIAYFEYAWNREVNMIYLEQPFGVGFSAANTAKGEKIIGGDQNAADDMDAAIRDFMRKFPEYAENTLYLSAESWGGHYVPMTSFTILTNNDAGAQPHLNFKGFLVGNPSTDAYENKYGFVGDIYGHGLLKSADWSTWREQCWDNADAIDTSAVFSAIHTRAYYAAWNANVYALDFPQCPEDENWSRTSALDSFSGLKSARFQKDAHVHRAARKSMQKVLDADNYESLRMGRILKSQLQGLHDQIDDRLTRYTPPKRTPSTLTAHASKLSALDDVEYDSLAYDSCLMHWMDDYLNSAEVQSALHVKSVESVGGWGVCSSEVWQAWPDSDFDRQIEPYYTQMAQQWASPESEGLTMLIYSGDDDSVCGLQGTMYWLDRWGYDVNSKVEWEMWSDEQKQLGGYYTQYVADEGYVALHFLTVRSAGHMVPTTQPERALTVLRKFLYEFQ